MRARAGVPPSEWGKSRRPLTALAGWTGEGRCVSLPRSVPCLGVLAEDRPQHRRFLWPARSGPPAGTLTDARHTVAEVTDWPLCVLYCLQANTVVPTAEGRGHTGHGFRDKVVSLSTEAQKEPHQGTPGGLSSLTSWVS